MAFERSIVSQRRQWTLMLLMLVVAGRALCIRIPDRVSEKATDPPANQLLKTAVFALGSFWRSEAVFGCLNGVVRTTVGYAGGSKTNPEYRSLGDHAESVQVVISPSPFLFVQFFISMIILALTWH